MIANKMFAAIAGAGTYTAATAPTAAAAGNGAVITISDLNNSQWRSDGTYWRPLGGQQLIYSAATDCDPITSGTGEAQLTIGAAGITVTIPALVMAPSMEIRHSHSIIKTGTAGSVTQRIRQTNVAGTNLGYTTALGTTAIGARASMILAAGGVSGGNIQLTNVMTGTTTAEVGSATAANISITQAIASPLVLFPTIQNASATDSTVVRSFKVWVRG
jgi:hypothetical protein